MRPVFILIFFNLIFASAFGQIVFEKRIDIGVSGNQRTDLGLEGVGNSVSQTSDGGYFIGGYYLNRFTDDPILPFVAKLDMYGNMQWSRRDAAMGSGYINSVLTNSNNVNIAIGIGNSDSAGQMFITMFDQNGNELTSDLENIIVTDSSSFSVNNIFSCALTSDDGFIIGVNDQNQIAHFLKYAKSGNIEWGISFQTDSLNSPVIDAVAQLRDGSFLIAAENSSPDSETTIFTRLSYSGSLLWQKTILSVGPVTAIIASSDGGFVITGALNDPQGGNDKSFVMKFDSGGGLLWNTVIDAFQDEEGFSVAEAVSGDLVIAGIQTSDLIFGGFEAALLERIEKNGTPLSIETMNLYGESGNSQIVHTQDDGFIIIGTVSDTIINPYFPSQSIFVLKFNNDLAAGCNIHSGLFATQPFHVVFDSLSLSYSPIGVTSSPLPNSKSASVSYAERDFCDPLPASDPLDINVTLYPNPLFSDELSVSFDGIIPAGEYKMIVHDLLGQVMKDEPVVLTGTKEDIPLDIHNYSAGVYYIELWSTDGAKLLRRLKLMRE